MESIHKKGLFITFEGGEGAGKTTLIQKIETELLSKGFGTVKTREPGGTPIGEAIRALLLSSSGPISPYTELCLFLASRSQHIEEVIVPALKEGKIVLCDRFNDSSIAYQGGGRGLGIENVKSFSDFVCQKLNPDLTLYLDLDPEIGLGRAAQARARDRIESEEILFHKKIREAYLEISRAAPTRFRMINGNLSAEKVFEAAIKWVERLLETANQYDK